MLSGLIISVALSWDSITSEDEDDHPLNQIMKVGDEVLHGGWEWEGVLNEDIEPEFGFWNEELGGMVIWFRVTLTWEDEPASMGYTNEPDIFQLVATVGDNRKSYAQGNIIDYEGKIEHIFNYGNKTPMMSNYLYVYIELIDAGDQYPNIGPRALSIPDTSNSYRMETEYEYREILT